jgi:hypothetical protein
LNEDATLAKTQEDSMINGENSKFIKTEDFLTNDANGKLEDQEENESIKRTELLKKLISLYTLINDIDNINNDFRQLYGSKKSHFENKRSYYDPKDIDKKRPGWALAYGK